MARQPKKQIAARKSAPAATGAAKPKMVVEGDSWEHLPHVGLKALPTVGGSNWDLARALADRFEVHNIAYWGDTIAEIARLKHYMAVLRDTKAPYLLLGGGGNDLLAGGNFKNYLRLYRADRPVSEYINDQFYFDLQKVILNYRVVLADLASDKDLRKTQVIVHGYDYAQPTQLGWLGEPMEFMGIDRLQIQLRADIVKHVIDAFNHELKRLSSQHGNVIYVDFRGIVKGRWHDELHPRKEAFTDLANHLVAQIY